jgi:hypothetical protein
VFIVTCGDLLETPPDLTTYQEFEEKYFGDVRAHVPDAKCFIVANWSGDKDINAQSMTTGLVDSEKTLIEKMNKIEEIINGKASPNYRGSETERREKESLFACIGNEKMRQHFWETATKNAGRPLTLLCRCLLEAIWTLFKDVSASLDFLETYQKVSIGEELETFASAFSDCRGNFFIGPAIPKREHGCSYEESVKNVMCDPLEEYQALCQSGVTLPVLPPPKFAGKVCFLVCFFPFLFPPFFFSFLLAIFLLWF